MTLSHSVPTLSLRGFVIAESPMMKGVIEVISLHNIRVIILEGAQYTLGGIYTGPYPVYTIEGIRVRYYGKKKK